MWGLKSLVLPSWVKPAAVLAVLAIAWSTGWHMRGTHERAKQAKQTERMMDWVLRAQKEAVAANGRLRDELAKPKAADKVHELIRENPVNCRVPDAVDDGLRQAIREANRSAG